MGAELQCNFKCRRKLLRTEWGFSRLLFDAGQAALGLSEQASLRDIRAAITFVVPTTGHGNDVIRASSREFMRKWGTTWWW